MDCSTIRAAVSATLDGEDPGTSTELTAAHLRTCAECTTWASEARATHRRLRVLPAEPVPDLLAPILAAIAARPDAEPVGLRACRWVLACCGILQLAATLPALLGDVGGPIHLDHELGSWDLALAVGLMFAALRPARAWGMLPLVGAIAVALAATAAIDVSSGHTTLSGESSHLMELIGLVFLWNVARLDRGNASPLAHSLSV